ncbi:MAG: hypothetical protein N2C12_17405 [Planctomycetales bacterium]
MAQRHFAVRFAVLFVVAICMGLAARLLTRYLEHQAGGQMYWNWRALSQFGWLWIAWTCLVAGFLAAMLLLLRSTGYRLVREAKP